MTLAGDVAPEAGAGNPVGVGCSGDGGPATSAFLNGPAGLAIDSVGNLLVADSGNNRVRKVFAVAAPGLLAGRVLPPLPGDVNQDGQVGILDVVALLRIVAGLAQPTERQRQAADLDGDGKVDVADALLLLRRLVGL